MSGESAQSLAAGKYAELQSALAERLAGISLPGLGKMIGEGGDLTNLLKSTDSGQILSSWDKKAYDSSLGELRSGFGLAGRGASEAINYGALRGGEGRLSGAGGGVNSALGSTAQMLERDQFMAEQNLKYASNAAGMTNYNKILNLFGQGSQTALGLGAGNANAAVSALSGMSSQSQGASILGGASTGASLGSVAGPYGAAIGAVVGAGAGYMAGP